jgi:hypothetical protein
VSANVTTVSMSPTTHDQLSFLCASISRSRQFTMPSQPPPGGGGAWNVNAAPGSSLKPITGKSHSASSTGSVSARHTFSGA